MDNIVQGMFGVSPDELNAQRQARLEQGASQWAQMNPFERANYGIYKGAGMLAGNVARSAGMVMPGEEEYAQRQQVLSQVDMSSPEGILKAAESARQRGDAKLQLQLQQLANQRQEELTKQDYTSAQAEQLRRVNANVVTKQLGNGMMQDFVVDATGKQLRAFGNPYSETGGVGGAGSGVGQEDTSGAYLGVPFPRNVEWGGVKDPKSRAALQGRIYEKGVKNLNEVEAELAAAKDAALNANRFKELNSQSKTGSAWSQSSLGQTVVGLGDPLYQEMTAITAKIAPMMRQAGTGATSDYDAKQFERATLSVGKRKEVNDSIADAIDINAKSQEERAEFLRTYLMQNRTIGDANHWWKKYANENPIFDPNKKGTYSLNPTRQSFAEWWSKQPENPANQGTQGNQPAQTQQKRVKFSELP